MALTKRKVAAEMCKREGGKSEAKIADTMQLIGHLFDIIEEKEDEGTDFLNKMTDEAFKRTAKKKSKG